MSFQEKVFLVTGSSAGLGYQFSKAILAAGHKLIATSRNPSKTPEKVAEIESHGGKWAPLDVTSPSLDQQFSDAVRLFGRVDVLINNAGIAMAATVEDLDMSETRKIFETNVFGVMRLAQLVIPLMRNQGGGTIVNFSSGGTLTPVPVVSSYYASKGAIETFTESLKNEVAAFNIRVLLAHPGGMRTGFVGNSPVVPLSDAYKGTPADHVLDALQKGLGIEKIDPERAAQRVVEAVDGTGLMQGFAKEDVFRVPLGQYIIAGISKRIKELESSLKLEKAALSVDFED